MIVVSLDAASGGGGRSRSVLLPPPPVKRENEEEQGSPAGGAVDAGNQDKAENFERVVAVEDLGGLRGELPERGRGDAVVLEASWPCKRRRTAAAAARERPSAVTEASSAAAATRSPGIHGPANCEAGENGDKKFRVVYTARRRAKGLSSPGGSSGEALEERKEEKISSCDFAVGFQGQEVGEMARQVAATAISEGASANAAVDQVNRVELVHLRIPELTERGSDENGKNKVRHLTEASDTAAVGEIDRGMDALSEKEFDLHVVHAAPSHVEQVAAASHELKDPHIQETDAAHSNITNQSDSNITKQDGSEDSHIIGLSRRLQSLGVTSVTSILSKNVSASDCNFGQSRLLMSYSSVMDSPMIKMLTPLEHSDMHNNGLPIEALDRYGCSYDMVLRHLPSNNGYRLIGQWRQFLTKNRMSEGDLVELGAFRFEGRLLLTLLHCGEDKENNEKSTSSETEESEEDCSSSETVTNGEERASMEAEASREEWASRVAEANREEWTSGELEAMEGLLMLSNCGGGPKPQ
ncbi:hypothetical protein ABZP36_014029 [Zizania latifolia]